MARSREPWMHVASMVQPLEDGERRGTDGLLEGDLRHHAQCPWSST